MSDANMTLSQIIEDIESLGYSDQRWAWLDGLRELQTMLNAPHDITHPSMTMELDACVMDEFPEWKKSHNRSMDIDSLILDCLSTRLDNNKEYYLVEKDKWESMIDAPASIDSVTSDEELRSLIHEVGQTAMAGVQRGSRWHKACSDAGKLLHRLRNALRDTSTSKTQPLELRICELGHTILQHDRPYIFTVDPNCERCSEVAQSGHNNT